VAVIRFAEPRDIVLLQDIENAADAPLIEYLNATAWGPAPSGQSRAAVPGFLLAAAESDEGRAVGFAHVLEVDGAAHLEQLSVRPENARRGIGRALVEAAMAYSGERGHDHLTLRTFADVPWNAPFYATCGFTVTEPDSEFLRRLVLVEAGLQLEKYGPRVQMTVRVSR
jgi:GNAT superfamily N-acetyltransferase